MLVDTATQAKLTKFFADYPLKTYKKKRLIIKDYAPPEGVFYLESGRIRQYTQDRKGNEVTVNIFHGHTIVPMSWVLNDSANEYNYDALVESTLRIAPKDDVVTFLRSDPDLLFELMSSVFSRLDNTYMRIVHLMSSSAYVRILHILLIQAKRKQQSTGSDRNILLRFMSYDLAAYCGLSKETVSRQFKNLKENNIALVTQHGIEIPSVPRLEAELEKHL